MSEEVSRNDAQMDSLRLFNRVRATQKAKENTEVVKETMKLGKYNRESGRIKTTNTSPFLILGVAHKVPIFLAQWSGTVYLTAVHMDNFSLVLGLEFIDTVRPFSFKENGSIMIKTDQGAWSVPVTRELVGAKMISAIQVSRGIKKGQETFLAALIEEKPHRLRFHQKSPESLKSIRT
ncbi:unnamed protein product [Amaranthus hypochondriacus]